MVAQAHCVLSVYILIIFVACQMYNQRILHGLCAAFSPTVKYNSANIVTSLKYSRKSEATEMQKQSATIIRIESRNLQFQKQLLKYT